LGGEKEEATGKRRGLLRAPIKTSGTGVKDVSEEAGREKGLYYILQTWRRGEGEWEKSPNKIRSQAGKGNLLYALPPECAYAARTLGPKEQRGTEKEGKNSLGCGR